MAIPRRSSDESFYEKEVGYRADSKGAAVFAALQDSTRWNKSELEKLELILRTMHGSTSEQMKMGVYSAKGKTGDRYEFANSPICFRVYQVSKERHCIARLA